jgi:hypothetical protein
VLGGGYVVAPPSQGLAGTYQFIRGGLDDLGRLPCLQNLPPQLYVHYEAPQLHAGYEPSPVKVSVGHRHETLKLFVIRAAIGKTFDELLQAARAENRGYAEPLPDDEVIALAGWAKVKTDEDQNWAAWGGRVVACRHQDIDTLLQEDPDAFILETILKRYHGAWEFQIANGMAARMPNGGWGKNRLVRARQALIDRGRIVQTKARTRHHSALFRWVDPKSRKQG